MTLDYVNPGIPLIPPNAYPANQAGYGQVPPWGMPGSPTVQQNSVMSGIPYNTVYGNQAPQYPQQAPSYSAVKIDINGASVGTGGSQAPPAMPMYPGRAQMINPTPQYLPTYITAPPQPVAFPVGVNDMPVPPYIMPQQTAGAMPVPPQIPQMIPPPAINQQPMQQVQGVPVTPVPPQPVPVNTMVQTSPQLQPPAPNQQVMNEPAAPPSSQLSQVDPAVQPLFQAISAITPEQGQQVSFAQQDQAIRTIAQYAETFRAANEMIKADPGNSMAIEAKNKADTLIKPLIIDEKVFKGLVNIATNDTSTLSGAEKQQAESNKQISMWTLGILQKVFREEVNHELQKEGIPPMSLGEVPGISQIVGNIKSDPNPNIRKAGVLALMEAADRNNPEDIKLINIILNTAIEQDNSQEVKDLAQDTLKDLQKA